jgi:hypothetical protein
MPWQWVPIRIQNHIQSGCIQLEEPAQGEGVLEEEDTITEFVLDWRRLRSDFKRA